MRRADGLPGIFNAPRRLSRREVYARHSESADQSEVSGGDVVVAGLRAGRVIRRFEVEGRGEGLIPAMRREQDGSPLPGPDGSRFGMQSTALRGAAGSRNGSGTRQSGVPSRLLLDRFQLGGIAMFGLHHHSSFGSCGQVASRSTMREGGAGRRCGFLRSIVKVVVPVAVLALAGTASADVINDPGFDGGITNQNTWRAGTDNTGQWYGKGYSTDESGYAKLDDAANNWQRRTLMQGVDLDTLGAGTFTLSLETALTDYWKQLNYWKVIAVKDGANLDLRKNGFIWDKEMSGSETLYKDYAPDGTDDGSFYAFSGEFTITDDIIAEFDYLVIGLVGSRRAGDVLLWDNISLRAAGGAGSDVPEPASLAMMLLGAGFFGGHARKRRARRIAAEREAATAPMC